MQGAVVSSATNRLAQNDVNIFTPEAHFLDAAMLGKPRRNAVHTTALRPGEVSPTRRSQGRAVRQLVLRMMCHF